MVTGQLVSNVWYVQDLVKRAHEQDKAAFGELYERYWPRIYNYLCRQLDGCSQEAEDLTAEVFAKVYEKIGSYQFRGVPFSAWLFRIAHNQLIDHVRSRPRAPSAPLEDAAEIQEPSSLRALDRRLTADQIKGALQLLTEEQRQVVVLRFIEGLSTQQTAERMGKTEEAVKKLQARGLAALKRAMDCRSGCWRMPDN